MGRFLVLTLLFVCSPVLAGSLPGEDMPLLWGLPFLGILFSIAFIPLINPKFWHSHYGKVSLLCALSFIIPCLFLYGPTTAFHSVWHTVLGEYIPFIILLGSLFTITGGIFVEAGWRGTPLANTSLLAAGTALASWMGTTGAAMLLIRPLLKTNKGRAHVVHTVVFFIFLVANIGGSLTPLGDPPLFIGFLQGVSFFWPMEHLWAPAALLSVCLLGLYYMMDRYFFKREAQQPPKDFKHLVKVYGKRNFFFLAGVVLLVFMSGVWKPGIYFNLFGIDVALQNIARDLGCLFLATLSYMTSKKTWRTQNGFTWEPILEVSKLFFGIFVTVAPVIAILSAGKNGSLGFLVQQSMCDGLPDSTFYFWVSGLLSSFLDNAPTYFVFFHMAGGDAAFLMSTCSKTLMAISAGCVFMGAVTYIGNAPNFMVRAIAEEKHVKMPSFFGYMKWSVLILFPLFWAVGWLFMK